MEKDGDYLFVLVGFCICTFCMYRGPCRRLSEMKEKKGWEWNAGKDETPPCTGCMRLLISRYIVCQFVVILRWQHSAVCSVWSWVCAWMWVRLCDSSLLYRLQSGACRSSPMGTPLLIGCRDQCLWMFVWVYICVVVGSFLVSVFSSLLFLCFFFDKGGLIVFITTNQISMSQRLKLPSASSQMVVGTFSESWSQLWWMVQISVGVLSLIGK